MQRAMDGGNWEAPLLEPIIGTGQRAGLHGRGRKPIKQQCNPRADESLCRAVPRAGRATAGQDDAEAKDEAAHDDGYRFEIANLRRKHARASQQRQAKGMHRNQNEQGGKAAPRLIEENIAQHTGYAEAPALQHGTEDDAGEKSGNNHYFSLFRVKGLSLRHLRQNCL